MARAPTFLRVPPAADCQNIGKILWTYCESAKNVKYCQNIVKILWTYCEHIVEILWKSCKQWPFFFASACKNEDMHRDILTPPWKIMTLLITNGWETIGPGIMSQLGTSQGGRAEERGWSRKGGLWRKWLEGRSGEARARVEGGFRHMNPECWRDHDTTMNQLRMAYTVLTIPEWPFHERARTHNVQRYTLAWPGN